MNTYLLVIKKSFKAQNKNSLLKLHNAVFDSETFVRVQHDSDDLQQTFDAIILGTLNCWPAWSVRGWIAVAFNSNGWNYKQITNIHYHVAQILTKVWR